MKRIFASLVLALGLIGSAFGQVTFFGGALNGTGGVANGLTSLGIRSTGAAFDLKLANTEVLTATRTLTLKLNDAARTVDIAGNLTTAAAFTTSGANALTLTTTGSTNVTLPTSGTLAVNTLRTRQVFLSGSAATYTTPAGVRQIVVRMKGGGGGGSGSGTTTVAGGTGGTTTFNSITVIGGEGGSNLLARGGAGGTGGTGTVSFRMPGASGHNMSVVLNSATTAYALGGGGGGQGGGPGTVGSVGTAGIANSGGGGGGAGMNSQVFANYGGSSAGPGGGEGEYAEFIINSPAATYTYTVGASGAAGGTGTSGFAGSLGGSGVIIVDELY